MAVVTFGPGILGDYDAFSFASLNQINEICETGLSIYFSSFVACIQLLLKTTFRLHKVRVFLIGFEAILRPC